MRIVRGVLIGGGAGIVVVVFAKLAGYGKPIAASWGGAVAGAIAVVAAGLVPAACGIVQRVLICFVAACFGFMLSRADLGAPRELVSAFSSSVIVLLLTSLHLDEDSGDTTGNTGGSATP